MTAQPRPGREYVGESCTLDGRPASIMGRTMPFAVIADDDGRRVEYAWPTVARIMHQGGGRFKR